MLSLMRAAVHFTFSFPWNGLRAPMEFEDTIKTPLHPPSVVWYLEQFENDPCETVISQTGGRLLSFPSACRSITDWSYVGIWTVWWTFRAVNMS